MFYDVKASWKIDMHSIDFYNLQGSFPLCLTLMVPSSIDRNFLIKKVPKVRPRSHELKQFSIPSVVYPLSVWRYFCDCFWARFSCIYKHIFYHFHFSAQPHNNMGCGYKKVHCVSFFLHVLALSGTLVSMLTNYWVFVTDNSHTGLIWVCVNGTCTKRPNILDFEGNHGK